MTDSRVTPQAAEATARALYGADGYDVENWDRDKGEDWAADYRPAAEIALAAAAPLLCQPLQDEIDRLREQIEAVENAAITLYARIDAEANARNAAQAEAQRLAALVEAIDKLHQPRTAYVLSQSHHEAMHVPEDERCILSCVEPWTLCNNDGSAWPCSTAAALAAVPVGTGNPTEG